MRSVARQNWPLSFGVKLIKQEAADSIYLIGQATR
jgi:hypothetical protein